MRTPPSWFTKKLRAIDANLGVRDASDSQVWRIVQKVPTLVDHGFWNGIRLQEVKHIWTHCGSVKHLTGSFLDELPRYNTARYKNFEAFKQGTEIR